MSAVNQSGRSTKNRFPGSSTFLTGERGSCTQPLFLVQCALYFSGMLTLHDDLCARPRCPGTWACCCSDCCSPGRAVSRSRGIRDSALPCAPLSSSPPPRRSCSSNLPSRKRERDPRTPFSGPCTLSLRETIKTALSGHRAHDFLFSRFIKSQSLRTVDD